MPLRNPYAAVGFDAEPRPFSFAQLPAYLAWAFVGFWRCWRQTRHLGYLLQGLPAVALAGLLATLFVSRDQPVSPETIRSYLARARAAMNRDDFEQAEFCFRKLEKIAPQDREVVHEHALLRARQGEYFDAFTMMEALVADDDRSNDVKVHLWLAETALQNNDVHLEAPLDYARQHLVQVLNEKPDDPYAHFFFARLNILQNDVPNAIEHLKPIAPYSAELQLLLASQYMHLDPPDLVHAQSSAHSAADVLALTIEKTQTADVNTYHQLSGAYVILREFDKAIQTLRDAATRFDLDATRRQMARVYVAWSDDVRQQRPNDMGERIKRLEQALQAAPNEPLALHRMLEIASADGEGSAQAEQALRQTLAEGVAPAAVHFSLGALAAKKGDNETALMHFRQSQQLNPRTAVTLNNLAYIMIQSPDADLEQALELANQAIEMAPGAAPFRDTRGQVFTKLKRWSEAISDLEFANAHIDDHPSKIAIVKSLAVAYRGLGDEQTAQAYQSQYEQLVAEAAASQAKDSPGSKTPDFETKKSDAEPATGN